MVRHCCCALLALMSLAFAAIPVQAQGFFGCGPGGCYRPWSGGYAGGYGYGSPYGIYYEPSSGYQSYYLPPIYAPAELAYGPQPMKQFMGVDRNFGLGPLQNPPAAMPSTQSDTVAALAAILARQAEVADRARRGDMAVEALRPSGIEARTMARHYVGIGDGRFRVQDFNGALGRYRDATVAAPDLADGWFRMGLAYAALGQADRSAAALRRGLALDPTWPASDFRLAPLYEDMVTAKTSHLELLANRATANPADPDPLFVLGVLFHFDGQAERAVKFFEEAARLGDERGAGAFVGKKT